MLDKGNFVYYHSSTLKQEGRQFRSLVWRMEPAVQMKTYSKITPEGTRDLLFE